MATPPYDLVNDALNMARGRLNDSFPTIQPVSGKILSTEESFTQTLTNAAWRGMQRLLVNLGWSRFQSETAKLILTASVTADPANQCSLTWDGYDPGNGFPSSSPALPLNLIQPLSIVERLTGAINPKFYTMDQILNGLPRVAKGPYNKIWEWRQDGIYFPGATVSTDMILRFASFEPDFLDGVSPWFEQFLPILQGADALAYWICVEFCKARSTEGTPDPAGFLTQATEATKMIAERDQNRAYATGKIAEYGKMQDRFSPIPAPKPGQQRE